MSGPCTAIVLAGSRGGADALLQASGAAHKALIPVGGKPMLVWVVETLLLSGRIGDILIAIEQPQWALSLAPVAALVETGRVRLIKSASTPGESVLAAIAAADNAWPILVTTADHPLLRGEMIAHLLDHAPLELDAAAAVVEQAVIQSAYPHTSRTYLRFRDIAFSGANLFLLRTPNAAPVVAFWRHVEANRKRPVRLMGALGLASILRFVTGRLTLAQALTQLGRKCGGARLGVVRLPFAEAAIDVDKPADLALVSAIIGRGAS